MGAGGGGGLSAGRDACAAAGEELGGGGLDAGLAYGAYGCGGSGALPCAGGRLDALDLAVLAALPSALLSAGFTAGLAVLGLAAVRSPLEVDAPGGAGAARLRFAAAFEAAWGVAKACGGGSTASLTCTPPQGGQEHA